MLGLLVLPLVGLWIWFSYWLAGKASLKLLNPPMDGEITTFNIVSQFLLRGLLTVFIILLPFIDQLIAYPKWQQLCRTTSDIHWVEGIDLKMFEGRELAVRLKENEMTVFPMLDVNYYSYDFVDVETGRTVAVMPHSMFNSPPDPLFEFPSAAGGGTSAIFLHNCSTSSKSKKIVDYLNKYNLKVVGYIRNRDQKLIREK
jgi:hypothetical protein